ncbi:hypothetical protein NUW58_g8677 [Xylaria curta]|uniref:Uncharacterized protein n=1 Tax=Xylaria curta TaxID=42375 RepID=A0ACC1N686_9PEZI|nr:hypothetical protein NUW58_g8677 [Xylaria curta]
MSNATTFLIAFAAVTGASEAIRQIQSDARKKEHRSRKNNLIVHCLKSCEYSSALEGRRVVLSGDKVSMPEVANPRPLPPFSPISPRSLFPAAETHQQTDSPGPTGTSHLDIPSLATI